MPGEILDFLIVLPYMRQGGIIIQHDTVLDHRHYQDMAMSPVFSLTCIAQPVLFAVMRSEKYKPLEYNRDIYPTANIGAHRINEDTWKYIDDVFWALNLKWRYLPSVKDMGYIVPILEKHYSKNNVDMFLCNYELNKKCGTDWNPFVAAQQSMPVAAHPIPDMEPLIRRIAKLEKRTYAALAGIMGFLAAATMIGCIWIVF